MRLLIAVFLSVALISLHKTPINNLGRKAAITKPAGQVHQQVTAPAQVVRPVATLAAQTPQVQPVQGCDAYRSTFAQYGWDVNTAIAICKAESQGNIYAISSTCDRGLMQVNCIHADMVNGDLSELFNPAINISVAYRIYSGRGWSAWSTYLSKAYLNYE